MAHNRRTGWLRVVLVAGVLWWAGIIFAMFYRPITWTPETILGTALAAAYVAYVGWAAVLYIRQGFKDEGG